MDLVDDRSLHPSQSLSAFLHFLSAGSATFHLFLSRRQNPQKWTLSLSFSSSSCLTYFTRISRSTPDHFRSLLTRKQKRHLAYKRSLAAPSCCWLYTIRRPLCTCYKPERRRALRGSWNRARTEFRTAPELKRLTITLRPTPSIATSLGWVHSRAFRKSPSPAKIGLY